MATTRTLFLPDDQTPWTAEGMRTHLRMGKMKDTFYKEIFGWNDAELQDAVQRANDALERANIKPTEILSPIRFEKGTQSWTQGARKRLEAEEDLVEKSITTDRLFCLPHQKNDWLKPLWFRRDMTFGGRAAETVYDFPTITQKFFQYARECRKESLKRETSVGTGAAGMETTASRTPSSPDLAKKRSASPLSSNGKIPRKSLDGERYSSATATTNGIQHGDNPTRPTLQADHAVIHVGWITQQDYKSFSLEKDFRSLRTWFTGPEQLQYNYDEIRRSLRMTDDHQLKLFWFEDITGEPWIVKDDHAIPGAVERMHAKGKICFLLATDIEHVRALTLDQRRESYTLHKPAAAVANNTFTEIENQTVQILALDRSPTGTPDQQNQASHDTSYFYTGRYGRRMAKIPYIIHLSEFGKDLG